MVDLSRVAIEQLAESKDEDYIVFFHLDLIQQTLQ
jgi:hypothetical protein